MILCIVGSYKWRAADIPKAKAVVATAIATMKLLHGGMLEVVSGECPKGGVDIWAREEATRQGVPFKGFPPKANNKDAYMERNRRMAEFCDVLIRVVSPASTTYGSGVTAKWAKESGKDVLEIKVGRKG